MGNHSIPTRRLVFSICKAAVRATALQVLLFGQLIVIYPRD